MIPLIDLFCCLLCAGLCWFWKVWPVELLCFWLWKFWFCSSKNLLFFSLLFWDKAFIVLEHHNQLLHKCVFPLKHRYLIVKCFFHVLWSTCRGFTTVTWRIVSIVTINLDVHHRLHTYTGAVLLKFLLIGSFLIRVWFIFFVCSGQYYLWELCWWTL